MILFAEHHSPRLDYMAHWLGQQLFGKALPVAPTLQHLPDELPVLNYSAQQLNRLSYQMVPQGLLQRHGAMPPEIVVAPCDGLPAFFLCKGGDHPFDLLAAVFFLISRFEEYYPNQPPDEYGRYNHRNSLAHRQGFLKRPLVDEWVVHLKQRLRDRFPALQYAERTFLFKPTFDVDIAWSYKSKGLLRNLGGFYKDAIRGAWHKCKERVEVLAGVKQDPFDVFDDIAQAIQALAERPFYFFLLSKNVKGFDRNVKRQKLAPLIKQALAHGEAALHFSWAASEKADVMREEKQFLEKHIPGPIVTNRMHYLQLHLPQTCQLLLQCGIQHDYSMGYGDINGFRASTSQPFYWYDLKMEQATSLLIHPFCWMDANSIFEQKDSPEKALLELNYFLQLIQKVDGRMVCIWHNHLMGRDAEGRRWWQVFDAFMQCI
jgi:hypothetical protein